MSQVQVWDEEGQGMEGPSYKGHPAGDSSAPGGMARPVSLPSSESASEKAMLMPAPVAEAIPTKKAVKGWWVAKAVAKMDAPPSPAPPTAP